MLPRQRCVCHQSAEVCLSPVGRGVFVTSRRVKVLTYLVGTPLGHPLAACVQRRMCVASNDSVQRRMSVVCVCVYVCVWTCVCVFFFAYGCVRARAGACVRMVCLVGSGARRHLSLLSPCMRLLVCMRPCLTTLNALPAYGSIVSSDSLRLLPCLSAHPGCSVRLLAWQRTRCMKVQVPHTVWRPGFLRCGKKIAAAAS